MPRTNPPTNGSPNPPIHPPTTDLRTRRRIPSRVSKPPIRTKKMIPVHEKISRRLRWRTSFGKSE